MFFSPKFKKLAAEQLHFLDKICKYERDILGEKKLSQILQARNELNDLRRERLSGEEGMSRLKALVGRYPQFFAPRPYQSWAENVEVILVALVIALAIRAYFLQPFKIPTHSMKPTLYGILAEPSDREQPSGVVHKFFDFVWAGRTHHHVLVQESGRVSNVTGTKVGIFDVTEIRIGTRDYRIWTSPSRIRDAGQLPEPGRVYRAGETLVHFTVQSGDHLFVNKMTYHFRRPKHGEVFVFTIEGIRPIEESLRAQHIPGGQYYIKRCVGVPGQILEIDPPYLKVNGKVAQGPAFDRVHSLKDGYHGYVNRPWNFLKEPGDFYMLPADRYWAMGDNSENSWDSRGWGPVPRANLVGTGFVVYWPFTKRWGLID
jgi:signal peptidase I